MLTDELENQREFINDLRNELLYERAYEEAWLEDYMANFNWNGMLKSSSSHPHPSITSFLDETTYTTSLNPIPPLRMPFNARRHYISSIPTSHFSR